MDGLCGHGNEPFGSIKGLLDQVTVNISRYTLYHAMKFIT
jgi:hypothetical protein